MSRQRPSPRGTLSPYVFDSSRFWGLVSMWNLAAEGDTTPGASASGAERLPLRSASRRTLQDGAWRCVAISVRHQTAFLRRAPMLAPRSR